MMKRIVIGVGVLCALVALVVLSAGCVGGSNIVGDWVFDSSSVSSSLVDKTSKLHIDSDGSLTMTSTSTGKAVSQTYSWKKLEDGTYIVPEVLTILEIEDGKLKVSLLGMVSYYKRA